MGDRAESPGARSPGLADTLLHAPVTEDDRPRRKWAYPWWGVLIVSAFIVYHLTVILDHNTPHAGPLRPIHRWYDMKLRASRYIQATGNGQSWRMFAPQPFVVNKFMKVLVQDRDGELWDMRHEPYGNRRYPYLRYSRMGKINYRVLDMEGYQEPYAAWVCRQWEMDHGGEPAREVRLLMIWNTIPKPWRRLGRYDPMSLPLREAEKARFECKSTVHAQLPPRLRERFGFEPAPEGTFLDVRQLTWFDVRQQTQGGGSRP